MTVNAMYTPAITSPPKAGSPHSLSLSIRTLEARHLRQRMTGFVDIADPR